MKTRLCLLLLGAAIPAAGALRADLAPALTAAKSGAASPETAAAAGRELQDIISGATAIAVTDSVLATVPPAVQARPAFAAQVRPEARAAVPDAAEAEKSSFGEVWAALKRSPLAAPYPKARVTFSSFFGGLSFHLLGSAKRTLSDHRDLLPDFKKLIRPNGIALSGLWEITEETPYTGYFSQGRRALVIARASSFTDDTERGEPRSFGLALKLYPTGDLADAGRYKTANVFLIDDNGGLETAHFADAALTTHPKFSFHGGVVLKSPILAAVSLAQHLADKNPGYRQLYPVSQLGLAAEESRNAKTPERLLLRAAPQTPRVDAKDFREELDLSKYPPPGLTFDVFVGEAEGSPWKKIGRVRFSDSVVSRAVDHNLHFPHPRYAQGPADGY